MFRCFLLAATVFFSNIVCAETLEGAKFDLPPPKDGWQKCYSSTSKQVVTAAYIPNEFSCNTVQDEFWASVCFNSTQRVVTRDFLEKLYGDIVEGRKFQLKILAHQGKSLLYEFSCSSDSSFLYIISYWLDGSCNMLMLSYRTTESANVERVKAEMLQLIKSAQIK